MDPDHVYIDESEFEAYYNQKPHDNNLVGEDLLKIALAEACGRLTAIKRMVDSENYLKCYIMQDILAKSRQAEYHEYTLEDVNKQLEEFYIGHNKQSESEPQP